MSLTERGKVLGFALMLALGLLIGGLVEDHWLGGWPL